MAAYHFLSNMQSLKGTAFLGIVSLGDPDSLLQINGKGYHLLPLLMTLINILSAVVYTRKEAARNLIQPVLLALVFLVLLYDSPSALVLYWLCNNIFSLMKSLYYRLNKLKTERSVVKRDSSMKAVLFVHLALTVFFGLIIPLRTIDSSVYDFMDSFHYVSPLYYVYTTVVSYTGLFMIWGSIYVVLAGFQKVYLIVLNSFFAISVTCYTVCGTELGYISKNLIYDNLPNFSDKEIMGTFLAIVVLIPCIIWAESEKRELMHGLMRIIALACSIVAVIIGISVGYKIKRWNDAERVQAGSNEGEEICGLSKRGKNVVVIMLDRAAGALVPYALQEKPELYEVYDGFCCYPDTLSLGVPTVFGQPPLYGGYEYSYDKIKDDYSDKAAEAVRVLPSLFSAAGYRCTMSDDPRADDDGVAWHSLFSDIDNVYVTETEGKYSDYEGLIDIDVNRNFFFYSFFRTSIPYVAEFIYDHGKYLAPNEPSMIDPIFYDYYTALKKLPDLTGAVNDESGAFLMLCNHTTHAPCDLQLPDYIPAVKIDNKNYEAVHRNGLNGEIRRFDDVLSKHYQVFMASLLALGEWLDKLRSLGVYDNTRIIITADHGYPLGLLDTEVPGMGGVDCVNPLLLVKDFNAKGFLISDSFMANADVPTIACEGVIDDPVNPFTGIRLSDEEKKKGELTVPLYTLRKEDLELLQQMGYDVEDVKVNPYFTVHDSIFSAENWKLIKWK